MDRSGWREAAWGFDGDCAELRSCSAVSVSCEALILVPCSCVLRSAEAFLQASFVGNARTRTCVLQFAFQGLPCSVLREGFCRWIPLILMPAQLFLTPPV